MDALFVYGFSIIIIEAKENEEEKQMKYHNITKDDMKNGDGLRVVLWLAGCEHHCPGCQNPITWDPDDGLEFDEVAKKEIFNQLDKDYISGITFSGGDPLNENNRFVVCDLIKRIRSKYKNTKSIWIYTGYTWEEIIEEAWPILTAILEDTDVIVDGTFEENLADINYHWAGSTNQRVIDVQRSIEDKKIVLYKD